MAAEGAETPLDRFFVQDGAATITVTAVPLTQGQDLARFEQFVRGYVEDAGATTGVVATGEVDGVEAVAFDVRLDGADGAVRSREVLFARTASRGGSPSPTNRWLRGERPSPRRAARVVALQCGCRRDPLVR